MKIHTYSENELLEYGLKIEAALFLKQKPLSYSQLQDRFPELNKSHLQKIIKALIKRYQNIDSVLEIYQLNENSVGFRLNYSILSDPAVIKFTRGQDMTEAEVKTLAYVAYNQPVEELEILEMVGRGSKKALRNLRKNGFITFVRSKQTVLNEDGEEKAIKIKEFGTTPLFAEYFGIPNDINYIRENLENFIY